MFKVTRQCSYLCKLKKKLCYCSDIYRLLLHLHPCKAYKHLHCPSSSCLGVAFPGGGNYGRDTGLVSLLFNCIWIESFCASYRWKIFKFWKCDFPCVAVFWFPVYCSLTALLCRGELKTRDAWDSVSSITSQLNHLLFIVSGHINKNIITDSVFSFIMN